MPNIRDVAREAGVSRSTASLALRDDPRCVKSTRDRVQKVARRMGYRTNALVAAHMSNVRLNRVKEYQGVIAWLTDLPDPTEDNPGGDQRNFEGACRRARSLGYEVEMFSYNRPGLRLKRLADILVNRGIQGILVAPIFHNLLTRDNFPWEHFSASTIGVTLKNPQLHRVTTDIYRATFMMLDRLREKGYRRIGLAVREDVSIRVGHLVPAAYLVDMQHLAEEERIPPFSDSWEIGNFSNWYERWKPDAMITDYRDTVVWIREMGLKIPEEMGVVTLSHGRYTEDISGADQIPGSLGSAAVDQIIAQIHRNERGIPGIPKTLMVDNVWFDGATTRAG